MRSGRMRIIVGLLTVCSVELMSACAQGDRITVEGLITARTSDTIDLKTTDGSSITITLDDNTKVQRPSGHELREEKMPASMLVPGLNVSDDGAGQDATHILAKSITFDGGNLQTVEMIQTALNPTKQNVATSEKNVDANDSGKRITELSGYITQDQLDVRFASGSAEISAADQEALSRLAHNAVKLGFVIQVSGFADSSGNPTINQKLSMERAQNVIAYLILNCNVSVRRIVAPSALGEAAPVASNETKAGRTENRRVEVKVLLNQRRAGD